MKDADKVKRDRAVPPIADCRPDLDIIDGLARAIKRAYQKDGALLGPLCGSEAGHRHGG
jgi:hypothetical protein